MRQFPVVRKQILCTESTIYTLGVIRTQNPGCRMRIGPCAINGGRTTLQVLTHIPMNLIYMRTVLRHWQTNGTRPCLIRPLEETLTILKSARLYLMMSPLKLTGSGDRIAEIVRVRLVLSIV